MALPGAVNRHHVIATSLEALHDSAERYSDNVADGVDALLKNAKVTVHPDVYLSVPKPTVGMSTIHTDAVTGVSHFYVCVTRGTWTQVV